MQKGIRIGQTQDGQEPTVEQYIGSILYKNPNVKFRIIREKYGSLSKSELQIILQELIENGSNVKEINEINRFIKLVNELEYQNKATNPMTKCIFTGAYEDFKYINPSSVSRGKEKVGFIQNEREIKEER